MRNHFLLSIFLLIAAQGVTQTESFNVKMDPYFIWKRSPIRVNGRLLDTVSTVQSVRTNYPRIDTIVFMNSIHDIDTVLTRFRPDSSYYLSLDCCNAGFNFFTQKKWNITKQEDFDENFDSLRWQLYDNNRLNVKVTSTDSNDTIIAFHGDYNSMMFGTILSETESTEIPLSDKGFYSSSVNRLVLFQFKKDIPTECFLDDTDQLDLLFHLVDNRDKIDFLLDLQFRIMHNDTVNIKYDLKSGKYSVEVNDI